QQGADRRRGDGRERLDRTGRGGVDVHQRLRAQLPHARHRRSARRAGDRTTGVAQRQRTRRGRGERKVPLAVPRAGALVVRIRGRDPATGRLLVVSTDGPVIAHVRHVEGTDDAPWLLPGLVDLQVNGYGGHDVNGPDVTADEVVALVRTV